MSDKSKDAQPSIRQGAAELPREVSPEEYRQMVSSGQLSMPRKKIRWTSWSSTMLPTILIAAVSLAIGFVGGVHYQSQRQISADRTGANNSNTAQTNLPTSRRGFRRGSFGTVTNISNSSISINNQRSGNIETHKIDSNTVVSNNGSSASVSDIKTGDTVMVRPSPTNTDTAQSISITNSDSFGAPSMPPSTQPGGSSQNTPDSGSSSTI